MKELKPRVQIKIAGETLDYHYPEPDACKFLSMAQCPLKNGDWSIYNLKMPINKKYPPMTVLEFSLLDENKKVQMCFGLNIKVVDK